MSLGLTMVILIGLTLAFLLGWLRGRRDLSEDMQPALDELEGALLLTKSKRPTCDKCGYVKVEAMEKTDVS
jgi:hypothetical protein